MEYKQVKVSDIVYFPKINGLYMITEIKSMYFDVKEIGSNRIYFNLHLSDLNLTSNPGILIKSPCNIKLLKSLYL